MNTVMIRSQNRKHWREIPEEWLPTAISIRSHAHFKGPAKSGNERWAVADIWGNTRPKSQNCLGDGNEIKLAIDELLPQLPTKSKPVDYSAKTVGAGWAVTVRFELQGKEWEAVATDPNLAGAVVLATVGGLLWPTHRLIKLRRKKTRKLAA